ncbi:MAG: anaerobic ribonucleoside-triphosphate reductase activating protein, partial [Candidatus Nanoarchaeia archaeon]
MKIKHIHRTTLIDYPGKIACTIFLYGCNFRCSFCHNPELVIREEGKDMQEEEIISFLQERKKYLDGICITGGEPLLTLEEDFLRKVKALGYLIKLDTNGSFPDKLEDFINKQLIDFISMDVKSCKEKYGQVAGKDVDVDKIEKSMQIIINSGLDYEFRSTIVE